MNKEIFKEGKIINVKHNREFPFDEMDLERFTKVLEQDGLVGLLDFNVSQEYAKKIKEYNEDVTVTEINIDDIDIGE